MWIYPGFNIISTFDLVWSNFEETPANKRSINHDLSKYLWRILLLYFWRDFTLKLPHEEVCPGTKCAQIMVPRLWNSDGSTILGNDEDLNIQVENKFVDILCLYNCWWFSKSEPGSGTKSMVECLKITYRVKIGICNWGWTKIAKWNSWTWSSDTYESLLTRWWNAMVQKGLEWD